MESQFEISINDFKSLTCLRIILSTFHRIIELSNHRIVESKNHIIIKSSNDQLHNSGSKNARIFKLAKSISLKWDAILTTGVFGASPLDLIVFRTEIENVWQ